MHTLVIVVAGEVQEAATVIDVRALAILGSVLVPLVVGLVTKRTASDGLKAALGILGSVIVTVLAFVVDPGNTVVNWITVTNVFITSLVSQLTAYLAVYKPLGVAGTVAAKTGGFGLGSPPTLETENKGAEDVGQVENTGVVHDEDYADVPTSDEEQAILSVQKLDKPPLHNLQDGDPLDHVGDPVERNNRDTF